MKKNGLLVLLITVISFISCVNTPEIVHREYTYKKMFFGNHRFEFDIHLENIGNSGKIHDLINNLIYSDKGFDEYIEYIEKKFVGDRTEADYPPIINDDGTEYFYKSYLNEKYSIIFNSNTYIIFKYNMYNYYSGAMHGYYWIKYFVIDLKKEKILDIDDLIYPISDDLLKEMIAEKDNIYSFNRKNIWPPDTVNFCNENIELIWNTYTITSYVTGIRNIEIPNEIIEQYLTDKGKILRKIIAKGKRE